LTGSSSSSNSSYQDLSRLQKPQHRWRFCQVVTKGHSRTRGVDSSSSTMLLAITIRCKLHQREKLPPTAAVVLPNFVPLALYTPAALAAQVPHA
jgi:hypothetical protein